MMPPNIAPNLNIRSYPCVKRIAMIVAYVELTGGALAPSSDRREPIYAGLGLSNPCRGLAVSMTQLEAQRGRGLYKKRDNL
jgi:hypothetical protein